MHRYRYTGPDEVVFPGLATSTGTVMLRAGDVLEVAEPIDHPWLVLDAKAKPTVTAIAIGDDVTIIPAAELPATPEED